MADRDFLIHAGRDVGHERRFGIFRLTSVIGFLAIACWLFLDGQHSRLTDDLSPRWLLETPGWFLGSVALGLAMLAAVLPAVKIEAILWDLLRVAARVRDEPDVRGLGHHDVIELELSGDGNAEEDADVIENRR